MIYIGYIRVSGLGQINGDGLDRQKRIIKKYCFKHKKKLKSIVSDEGITGTTEERDGFLEILELQKDFKDITIIVESADRLGRKLFVQEFLIEQCRRKGIQIISVRDGSLTETDDESRIMYRQILGVFAEFEKTRLVKRLKSARDKIRKEKGKCEGPKSYAEVNPQLIKRIKQLYRKPPKWHRKTIKQITDILNEEGFRDMLGNQFKPTQISNILTRIKKGNYKIPKTAK